MPLERFVLDSWIVDLLYVIDTQMYRNRNGLKMLSRASLAIILNRGSNNKSILFFSFYICWWF